MAKNPIISGLKEAVHHSRVERYVRDLEKQVGFDPSVPCIYCEQPVGSLSVGGPLICPACDCGYHRDGRQWTYSEAMAFYRNAHRRMDEYKNPSGKN